MRLFWKTCGERLEPAARFAAREILIAHLLFFIGGGFFRLGCAVALEIAARGSPRPSDDICQQFRQAHFMNTITQDFERGIVKLFYFDFRCKVRR